jgi:hypothetical protein
MLDDELALAASTINTERNYNLTRTFKQRLTLLLTTGLATVLVALAFTSASASAIDFCGGQTVNNQQSCFGAARSFYWIRGAGRSTGVCVGYNEIFLQCSGGARSFAEYRFGSYIYANPRISGNSPSNTVVENGETY